MSMTTLNMHESFCILKPVCDNIIKTASIKYIVELRDIVPKVAANALQELQEYVLYPLEYHLQFTNLKFDTKIKIIDSLKEVLLRVRVKELQRLWKLYSLLFFQIFDASKSSFVADVPEELKLNVVECVNVLLRQASTELLSEFYERTNVPKLSQGLFICIHLAQLEMLRSLRIASIDCIMIHCYVHDAADPNDVVFKYQVGDVIMLLMPGIVKGLHAIATGEEKQGYKVIKIALQAWARIITIVFEDSKASDHYSSINIMQALKIEFLKKMEQREEADPLVQDWGNHSTEEMKKCLETTTRSDQWIRAAAEKITILTKSLSVVQQHPHWKVRLQLAVSCNLIISKCARNLNPAVFSLIEILIVLSEDNMEEVALFSKEAINTFSEKCEVENVKCLLDILEENFYNVVTKLPRILNGTDDTQQLTGLNMLAGNIKLLGPKRLPQVLSLAPHLQRLVISLIHAVELETSVVSLLEDCSVRDFETNKNFGLKCPWKKFKHFTETNILEKIEEICKLLGQFGDLDILCDHLLEMFHTCPWYRKEVTLLLNEIISGGLKEDSNPRLHIVKGVLNTYLEKSNWDLPLSVSNNNEQASENEVCSNLGQAQSNIVQTCLLVEGIGKIASAVGPAFNIYLLKTLYAILEKAGSPHGLVSAAGIAAVQDVAEACEHRNITELVQANVDYISFHITMKLRSIQCNPGVLDVLNVVLQYSNIDMLPHLNKIVSDVLLQSHDSFEDCNTVAYLRAFKTFIVCIRHRLREQNEVKVTEMAVHEKSCHQNFSPSQIVKTLIGYHNSKQICSKTEIQNAEELYNEDIENAGLPDDVNMDEDVVKKEEIPSYVQMAASILQRCLHFLPSKKMLHKLLVLETLQEGLPTLVECEYQLLPLVHQIWSPLVNRFLETSEPLIVRRSFSLLCTLAQTAKEFIRARTLKQVLPSLCHYLTQTAEGSRKKDSGSAYWFTQVYKLQLELLLKLGDLAVDLNLYEWEINQVLTAALPYLSNQQPSHLQSACIKLFKRMSVLDGDAVWLHISVLSGTSTLEPPTTELISIQFASPVENKDEFTKNAKDILNYISIDYESNNL